MSNFTDGAPTTPEDYLNLGCEITPCKGKRPILKGWQEHKSDYGEFTKETNIGLKMTGLTDIDVDNHFVKDLQENIYYPLHQPLAEKVILVRIMFFW